MYTKAYLLTCVLAQVIFQFDLNRQLSGIEKDLYTTLCTTRMSHNNTVLLPSLRLYLIDDVSTPDDEDVELGMSFIESNDDAETEHNDNDNSDCSVVAY